MAFTPTEFLAIAFDAGGATTGPTAVPFILALGLVWFLLREPNKKLMKVLVT